MSTDYLVRATALEGRVRAFALEGTAVVDELRDRHGLYPVPTAAVGRAAMGALLLAAWRRTPGHTRRASAPES
jgi:molecular chaperone Hsp33